MSLIRRSSHRSAIASSPNSSTGSAIIVKTDKSASSDDTIDAGSILYTSGGLGHDEEEPLIESGESPTALHLCSENSNSNSAASHYCTNNNSNAITRKCPPVIYPLYQALQQLVVRVQHNPDTVPIATALMAWFGVGVLAICTTKLLLSTPIAEGGVPSPLCLTFQQMLLGSHMLKWVLRARGFLQPWPSKSSSSSSSSAAAESRDNVLESHDTHDGTHNGIAPIPRFVWWKPTTYYYYISDLPTVIADALYGIDYLVLTGLFNGLDFLASNTSFSHSSATFVETIKASEPITTSALAIWWGLDRLGNMETLSLTLLIAGVLLSTYANATATAAASTTTDPATDSIADSVKTCLTVMTANLCFAFRAMCQKLLRNTTSWGSSQKLDDFNLLCRMQQTGAASLLGPVLLFQHNTLLQMLFGRPTWHVFGYYVGLSLVNAWAFATYSLASCYILSRISVVQHAGLGCLRRMLAILVTSVAFGVPISSMGALGIVTCVVAFCSFTHFRFQKQAQSKKSGEDAAIKTTESLSATTSTTSAATLATSTGKSKTRSRCRNSSGSGVETASMSSQSSSSGDLGNFTQQREHL